MHRLVGMANMKRRGSVRVQTKSVEECITVVARVRPPVTLKERKQVCVCVCVCVFVWCMYMCMCVCVCVFVVGNELVYFSQCVFE